MTTNIKTVNVRIKNSTHEELKALCDQEGMLIGRQVDKALTKHIDEWKTEIKAKSQPSNPSKSG